MKIKNKKCGQCGKTKSINKFYKNSKTKSGYSNKCKKCWNTTGRPLISEAERALLGTSTHAIEAKIEYIPFDFDKKMEEVFEQEAKENPYCLLYCEFTNRDGKLELRADIERFKDIDDWKVQCEKDRSLLEGWIIDLQKNTVLHKPNQDISSYKFDLLPPDSKDYDAGKADQMEMESDKETYYLNNWAYGFLHSIGEV